MKHKPAPVQGATPSAHIRMSIRPPVRSLGLAVVLLIAPSLAFAQLIVSVVAPDAIASETPADNGQFVIRRIGTGGPVTINYLATGSASPEADYTPLAGTVTLNAGAPEIAIPVIVSGDDGLFEGDETVTIIIEDGIGGIVMPPGSATITIADSPHSVTASPTSDAGENPATVGQISVSLGARNESANPLAVNYSVAGSAIPATDYLVLDGVAVIPVGSSSASIDVTPLDDDVQEGPETVEITLTGSSNTDAPVGMPASASLLIADDDDGSDGGDADDDDDDDDDARVRVSISASDDTAAESPGNSGAFVIRLDSEPARPVKIDYSVTGSASPGNDYAPLSGGVTLNRNHPEALIAVDVPGDDAVFEGDETITINLIESDDLIVESGAATVTILDSEYSVTVSSSSDASESGADAGHFTALLGARNESGKDLGLQYSIAGSATPATDFVALGGVATIPVGSSSASIDVTPIDDTLQETAETVEITLTGTSHSGVSVGTPATASLSIADNDEDTGGDGGDGDDGDGGDGDTDDAEVRVSVIASDDSASETPADNGEFVIRRVSGSSRPVTISYSVSGSASPGEDYAPLSGSVTLDGGNQEVPIAVNVAGDDDVFEGDESVTIILRDDDDVFIETGAATATIQDSPHSVTASPGTDATESPAGNGRISVSLGARNASGSALTVEYSVAGSATAGTDFEALSGTVRIPVGASDTSVDITPLDDDIREPPETVEITLTATSDAGAPVGTPATASVSIADDDSGDDDDGDGVSNAEECPVPDQCPDTDQDSLTNDQDADDDGDGIPTASENAPDRDTDDDDTPDYLDNDDDGDGRLTGDEDANSDGDGNPSTNPTDLDGDSIPDYLDAEDRGGSQGDADGDGLSNEREEELGTDPEVADTDGDGVNDGDEVAAGTDPLDEKAFADADGDLVPDAVETGDGTDPNDPDSFADGDGGGTADHVETITYASYGIAVTSTGDASDDRRDLDGDGLPDRLEISIGSIPDAADSPTANGAGDDGGDGISNAVEAYLGTLGFAAVDPVSDLDRDGYPDAREVALGLDPLRADERDADGDGVPEIVEALAGVGIDAASDTDGDGVPDAREIALGADSLDAGSPIVNGALDDDGDGVSNAIEEVLQTIGASDDADASSDGDDDGISDADEIRFGTDPLRDEQPAPWIVLSQADIGPVNAILAGGGAATATALVGGHQSGTLAYDWSESSNAVLAVSSGGLNNRTLTISPRTLPPGPYDLVLSVQRTLGDYSSDVSTLVFTVRVMTELTAAEVADADNDGVPDFSDNADARAGFGNELPAQSGARIRAEAGIRLQLGTTARLARTGSARVTAADIASAGDVANSADEFDYLSGIYDFEVTNLPEVGATVRIVIPQATAIGDFPEYRKFQPDTGWVDFVQDENNTIASAAGASGACPPPGDDSYRSGLTAGHFCIQLGIEDGGPNDADAALGPNGVIKDPSGAATPKGEVVAGQGGGRVSPASLLVLGLFALLAARRRSYREARCTAGIAYEVRQ